MSIFFKASFGSLLILLFIFSFNISLAQGVDSPGIQIDIGGFNDSAFRAPSSAACPPGGGTNCLQIDWISQYIGALYRYGVGLAAVLSVVMIMIGGFIYLTAGGSPTQVGKAKDFIISSMAGLLLALFSFIILQTVNPALVNNRGLIIQVPIEDPEVLTDSFDSDIVGSWLLRGMDPLAVREVPIPDTFTQNFSSQQFPFNEAVNFTRDESGLGYNVDWDNMTVNEVNNFSLIIEQYGFDYRADEYTPGDSTVHIIAAENNSDYLQWLRNQN